MSDAVALSEFAGRHLGKVSVEWEPGVFLVTWGPEPLRRFPIPEYLVTRRDAAKLVEIFDGVLQTLLPESVRSEIPEPDRCGKKLECGSNCCLRAEHLGECECVGDEPGSPGSCPA
jgi:hypothetical protein